MTDPMLFKKKRTQFFWFFLSGIFMAGTLAVLVVFFSYLLEKGIKVISWEFLTQSPRKNMTEGGIMPAIVGTFYVSSLTVGISVPLGIGCAIYLNEYVKQGRLVKIIRLCIRNLAGVPSIVYGLFGLGIFAATLKLGTSILTSALTLAIMSLPWVITASEEALKAVPNSFREAGLALGSTKWQTIRYLVLPVAIPGMATGSILSLARSAGETAPIILTGAAFFLPVLPQTLRDRFMALPYHLFILATQHTKIEQVRPLAYGTALVLILVVLLLNLVAILWRAKIRKSQTW
jgi:phosphate transport system permease protein